MRTCPGCNQVFPSPTGPTPHNARAVWTCSPCCELRLSPLSLRSRQYKARTPGAIEGHGPKRASPETQARLAALFRTDPEKVIHKLCDLMEGFHAGEKLKAIARAARKGQGICPGGA